MQKNCKIVYKNAVFINRGGMPMLDSQIVQLYWDRDERAIPETAASYGGYCFRIAYNILSSTQDAEECVNDTWLRTWNSIPPHRPKILSPFLGRITRNLALHLFQRDHAKKRGGGEITLVFEELADCVSGRESEDQIEDELALKQAISDFLFAQPVQKRKIFVLRYWYADSVAQIAKKMHISESSVSVTLHRLRTALRAHLEERGFTV